MFDDYLDSGESDFKNGKDKLDKWHKNLRNLNLEEMNALVGVSMLLTNLLYC